MGILPQNHPRIDEVIPKFYRVYDCQTGSYMATGYNAESVKELQQGFISFFSVDTDEDTLKRLEDIKFFYSYMKDNGFSIEGSISKFEENEY